MNKLVKIINKGDTNDVNSIFTFHFFHFVEDSLDQYWKNRKMVAYKPIKAFMIRTSKL
jgi:hypothetical protein